MSTVKARSDQGSRGSPIGHPRVAPSQPTSQTASTVATSGHQLMASRPRKRPLTSSRLLHGRLSSTSTMRSRSSRERTSKAMKTRPTMKSTMPHRPRPAIRYLGLIEPTEAEYEEKKPWMAA